MASDTYTLTKHKKDLAVLIDEHVERERSRLSFRHTMWNLAWWYMNGARRFDQFNPATGLIRPHTLDEDGNLEFQSQELLSAIDRVAGQLATMDVRPKANRTGLSLSAIRDRAKTQIIGDALTTEQSLDAVKQDFSYTLACLGSCGITGEINDHPTIGLTADYEMVHPREMFPFPSLAQDHTKVRGMVRERVVPLDWLAQRVGKKVKNKSNMNLMEWYEAEAGTEPDYDRYNTSQNYGGGGSTYTVNYGKGYQSAGAGSNENTKVDYVRIRELWMMGHRGLVTRYSITSGGFLIDDFDFEGLEVYCPIGWARFMNNGSFHGSGMFDLLFSISRQLEKLLKQLFNNIADIDRYGMVVLPQGQFNKRKALQDVGNGLKVMTWEPDIYDNGFRPFNIQPFNSGDVPGKTAAFAKELMQSINPWQDLLREKGRVDSAAGLSFLDEKTKGLMATSSRQMANAWGQCHRSVIAAASRGLTESRKAIPVTHLTLDLAGAQIDPESHQVSFASSPIPSLAQIEITVREISPRSEVARKQEALQMFGMEGLNDPQRFLLLSLSEGLDFAVYMGEERAAYETIVRNCLILYGDGQTPGEVWSAPYLAAPELQMRILQEFMSSPAMMMADTPVVEEFRKYREFLLDSMGMVLPEAVPNPDDLALLLTAQEQAQGQPGLPPKESMNAQPQSQTA